MNEIVALLNVYCISELNKYSGMRRDILRKGIIHPEEILKIDENILLLRKSLYYANRIGSLHETQNTPESHGGLN